MPLSADQYLLFISVVALIVVTPGPNMFLLLGMPSGGGKVPGLVAVTGICAAILSHAALALLGVGAVIATSAVLFTTMKVIGACYLIWMGLKSLSSLREPSEIMVTPGNGNAAPSAPQAFARGYMSNILNPKPAIFYVAAFPQFLTVHQPGFYATGGLLGLTHALIALMVYGSVVLLMQRLKHHLLRPVVSRLVKSVSGAALILLGGRLLTIRSPT